MDVKTASCIQMLFGSLCHENWVTTVNAWLLSRSRVKGAGKSITLYSARITPVPQRNFCFNCAQIFQWVTTRCLERKHLIQLATKSAHQLTNQDKPAEPFRSQNLHQLRPKHQTMTAECSRWNKLRQQHSETGVLTAQSLGSHKRVSEVMFTSLSEHLRNKFELPRS